MFKSVFRLSFYCAPGGGSSKPIEVAGTDPDDPIPVNEPAAYSVVAVADAYVRNGTAYQNTNHGSETGLVV